MRQLDDPMSRATRCPTANALAVPRTTDGGNGTEPPRPHDGRSSLRHGFLGCADVLLQEQYETERSNETVHRTYCLPRLPGLPERRLGCFGWLRGLRGQAGRLVKPAEPVLGAQLIGKLEGPDRHHRPGPVPQGFKEAPALAELVKAGKLPPVEQRVSQEPLVIKPVHEIGKYGGTWRGASPARPTTGTASGRPAAPTTSCSGTTPARRSSRTSPRASRFRTAARPPSSSSARA